MFDEDRADIIASNGNTGEHYQVIDLLDKAWRVINSCETLKQARGAMRYLDLLSERHPDLDVLPLRKELKTLFDI